MKVKELLEYESFVTKRKTPSDMMNEGDLNLHWSESKGEHIDLVDMDLVHLIRSYSKCLDMGKVSNTNLMIDKLDTISKDVASVKNLLVDKSE